MRRTMIVCSSQTEALKCTRLLQGAGVSGALRKPPRERLSSSCAWGVCIRAEDRATAHRRMQEKNFWPANVYDFDDMDDGGRLW